MGPSFACAEGYYFYRCPRWHWIPPSRIIRPRCTSLCARRLSESDCLVHQSQTYQALTVTLESSVELVGTLKTVPTGQSAPGGHELIVDYWQTIGAAPGADDAFSNRLNEVRKII